MRLLTKESKLWLKEPGKYLPVNLFGEGDGTISKSLENASLAELKDRFAKPAMTEEASARLLRLVKNAQKGPPDSKSDFVKSVNELLVQSRMRLLVPEGMALLAIRNGAIQFAIAHVGSRGFKQREILGLEENSSRAHNTQALGSAFEESANPNVLSSNVSLRLVPRLIEADLLELEKAIRSAQVGNPTDRAVFVSEINRVLLAYAYRLRTPKGLALLALNNGCVSFSISGGGHLSLKRHKDFTIEKVPDGYGRKGWKYQGNAENTL